MLLRPTQDTLTRFMARPATAELQSYGPVYSALKAYLITTSNPDKSTQEFLVPVLMEHWHSRNQADDDRQTLVRRQFDFYASELPFQNPFPESKSDSTAVGSARFYLSRFAATQALYSAMLSKANAAQPSFDFNKHYPGSGDVVVNTDIVPGAFTREGWGSMQAAIQHPEEYFQGEEWVLGPQTIRNMDRATLLRDLQTSYRADFLMYWRAFLQHTSVVPFGTPSSAAAKLTKLSGNSSPLLGALCAVSRNTSVGDPEIANMFQAPQKVEAVTCDPLLSSPGNMEYMAALIKLQDAVQHLAESRNDMTLQATSSAASEAHQTVRRMAANFPMDTQGMVSAKTESLLEDPITYAQRLTGTSKDEVNAGAQSLCRQYTALTSKYPFDPTAKQRANLVDLDNIFKPGEGTLWRLYMSSLNKFLAKQQGNRYEKTPGVTPAVTDDFLRFFNLAAAVSDAFYKGGNSTPSLAFSLTPVPSATRVQEITLTISGKMVTFRNGRGDAVPFSWSGSGIQEAILHVTFEAGAGGFDYPYSEPWAVFTFFQQADNWRPSVNQPALEWSSKTKQGTVSKAPGGPATVRFMLDMGGAPPVFQPNFWSTLRCPGPAVR